jgi:thiopeptide-type bacteriocin biosynthesis protein
MPSAESPQLSATLLSGLFIAYYCHSCRSLDALSADGLVRRWRPTIYEPEELAFGGPAAMDTAHMLFHADSSAILNYVRRHENTVDCLGRRELSVLLCSTLFHAAGLEWFEQGDVWHRVTRLRPLDTETRPESLRGMTTALTRLMTLDTCPSSPLYAPTGPLSFAEPWATAFDTVGRQLGADAQNGTLQRGLRAILTHHVIFHWNRLGLTGRTQAILARAARETLMDAVDTVGRKG